MRSSAFAKLPMWGSRQKLKILFWLLLFWGEDLIEAFHVCNRWSVACHRPPTVLHFGQIKKVEKGVIHESD